VSNHENPHPDEYERQTVDLSADDWRRKGLAQTAPTPARTLAEELRHEARLPEHVHLSMNSNRVGDLCRSAASALLASEARCERLEKALREIESWLDGVRNETDRNRFERRWNDLQDEAAWWRVQALSALAPKERS